MMSSEGFQYHFSIISKFICCDCYMKKNVAFTLISFAVLKWHECLSFQLPFELTVEIPVQLHLELEVNLLVHNVIEREIEREKVQMKPPYDPLPLKKVTEKRWHHLWMTPKKNIAWLRCTTWPLHLALVTKVYINSFFLERLIYESSIHAEHT